MSLPPPITLTTDFGRLDGYVATMKGVILSILPQARIVDISHDIEPQNVRHAAYVLAATTPFFPQGSVHVVVVDPGVGTQRKAIAVFTDRHCYIGPDNGIFTLVYQRESVRQIRSLTNPAYHLADVSNTFHGRDIFAPVGAHIAAGIAGKNLGDLVADPVVFNIPDFRVLEDDCIQGEIVHVDHFGNLISNIPLSILAGRSAWTFSIGQHVISGLRQSYGQSAPGELIVLAGSTGMLEVAVRDGSASQRLQLETGAEFCALPVVSA